MPLNEFLELLGPAKHEFTYKLSPLGIWSGYLKGKRALYLASGLSPNDLADHDLVVVKDPENGYFIKRKDTNYATNISQIYIGLPEFLIPKVKWVGRDYRTHPWSFIPGGHDIVVVYTNGKVLAYDWVTDPIAYVSKITTKLYGIEYSDFKTFSDFQKLDFLKRHVKCIYSRKIERDPAGNFLISAYIRQWDFEKDNCLL